MFWRANPDEETDWRAMWEKTARTVRKAERSSTLSNPYYKNTVFAVLKWGLYLPDLILFLSIFVILRKGCIKEISVQQTFNTS